MKILYVVHQFMPDYVGGTEQDTWEVAKRMHARGHQVAIAHRAPGTKGLVQSQRAAVPIYRMESGSMDMWSLFASTFHNLRLTQQFRTAFQAFQPDVVHFQHLRGLPARLVDWVKRQGPSVFFSLRDFWFVCPNAQLLDYVSGELCTTPGESIHCARCALARIGHRALLPVAPLFAPIMAARNQILRRTLQRADGLFTYSRFVQQWYGGHGAPVDSLHYVPRGIPRPEATLVGQRDDRRVRFVYIGGLSWQKGIHILIEAFNDLGECAKLIVAGDETQYPDYVEQLRKSAQHSGVEFLGRIDRQTVWKTLATADAVVVPSLWYETFSMLTREAFALQVPVIASDHGALAEAVTHEVNGLLIAPGDVVAWRGAMQRFVKSADLRARLRSGVKPPLTMQEYLDNLEAYYQHVDS